MKIVTSEEMRACDQFTINNIGIPSMVLMERAALSVINELLAGGFNLSNVLVVCGVGNNGGDGMAIARLLHVKGASVSILLVGNREHLTVDAKQQLKICNYYQIPVLSKVESMNDYSVIIDAIFGIGLARVVSGPAADVITHINQSSAAIIACDLPSGVSCNTGDVLGVAVKADLTVTFAFNKIGLTVEPGKTYAGKTLVNDIGIYEDGLKENNQH